MTPFVLVLLLLSLTAIPQSAAQNEDGENEDAEAPVENSESDNSTDISQVILSANEKLTSLSEGDIAKPKRRNARPCTYSTCKWKKHGSYVYIPFIIHPSYTASERRIIINAMALLNRYTCIRFFHWHWYWHYFFPDHIYFVPSTGCWSYVGRVGNRQHISLQRGLCVYPGMVQHSLLHTLGFHHEHSRWDRDSYVTINHANIQPGAEKNFARFATNNLGTGYNYRSIMHYGKYAYSRNGRPTIVSKRNPNELLGNSAITWGDVLRVNRLYCL